jgi:hypothetical protein
MEVKGMRCQLLLFACASAMASSAAADIKVSGSVDCDKADPNYAIPIPDQPGQVFVIEQHKCIWTKPLKIAGSASRENTNIGFIEVTGSGVNVIGVAVTTFENGDKTFVRDVAKVGPAGSMGKWRYTGGTGKLQGIKGQGISRCKGKSNEPGGAYTCDITGSYKLAAPKKKP